MGFSRQGYWSWLPFPSPEGLPNPGIKPRSPTLQADSLPAEPPGKLKNTGVGLESILFYSLPSLFTDLMHSSHLIQVLVTANHQLYPLDTTQSCSYNIEMPPAQHYPGYSYSYFRSQVILFPPTLCPQNPSLAFLIRLTSELLILQWQLWFFLSLLVTAMCST